MVISKRCKICTVIEPDNIPITGEYFGKLLPQLIEKISGIDLCPRKANGVLICQSCAVQMVHIDGIIDKVRNTLQRLKKLVKETKPKNTLKVQTTTPNKKSVEVEDDALSNTYDESGEVTSQRTQAKNSETSGEIVSLKVEPKTPKKAVRRKSVFPEEKHLITEGSSKLIGEINEVANLDDSNTQNGTKSKSPKKAARRKSLFNEDKQMNATDISSEEANSLKFKKIADPDAIPLEKKPVKETKCKQVSGVDKSLNSSANNCHLDTTTNSEESGEIVTQKIQTKTPKKAVRRKSVFPDEKVVNTEISSKLNEEINDMVCTGEIKTTKFKKIADPDAVPLEKKTAKATKRKLVASVDKSVNSSVNNSFLDDTVDSQATPMKRNKSISISAMDLTMDEDEGIDSNNETDKKNATKSLNCSICGKEFHKKNSLREHIETSHMGERLKTCPHCSSEFRSQQKYESHVFSEKCKNTNLVCQYPKCNKRFKTVHKMELHMHQKHSSQNESEAE